MADPRTLKVSWFFFLQRLREVAGPLQSSLCNSGCELDACTQKEKFTLRFMWSRGGLKRHVNKEINKMQGEGLAAFYWSRGMVGGVGAMLA